MLNFARFLCTRDENASMPAWIVSSFPVIEIVIMCLLAVCAIVMIVLVCMQKSNTNGISAISGQADTFYNRNKRSTLQGKIKTLTIIDAVLIMVLCIIYVIMNAIFPRFS